MKTYRLVIITALISVSIILFIYAWYNFKVSSKDIEISEFNALYTGGLMNVYLKRGPKASVVIKADDFVLDKVKVEVIDGMLRIYTTDFISGERVTDAHVIYTSVDHIIADNESTLTSLDEINSNEMTIEARGSSELKIRLRCDRLNLDMKNSANVQLAGSVNYFDFKIHDMGDLMAYRLESKNCDAWVHTGDQSPGIARINVSDSISVSIDGPRYIYYMGHPFIKNEQIIGSGRLINK